MALFIEPKYKQQFNINSTLNHQGAATLTTFNKDFIQFFRDDRIRISPNIAYYRAVYYDLYFLDRMN